MVRASCFFNHMKITVNINVSFHVDQYCLHAWVNYTLCASMCSVITCCQSGSLCQAWARTAANTSSIYDTHLTHCTASHTSHTALPHTASHTSHTDLPHTLPQTLHCLTHLTHCLTHLTHCLTHCLTHLPHCLTHWPASHTALPHTPHTLHCLTHWLHCLTHLTQPHTLPHTPLRTSLLTSMHGSACTLSEHRVQPMHWFPSPSIVSEYIFHIRALNAPPLSWR